MTEIINQQPSPLPEEEDIIREEISTRAIEALMSNYRSAQEAFLELVDNAIDNRLHPKPLLVRVRISRNELSVYNQGGQGLDRAGLKKFFVWGYSEKPVVGQIGFFGVGGKAAMGYLGKSMEVVCSAVGQDSEYRVFDPNWETREEGQWKVFKPESRRASAEDGYFRARVTNLKKEVDANAVKNKLADIYRPLLLDGSVKILVNNQEISPLQIEYIEDDNDLKPDYLQVQTRLGDSIIIKVGVLKNGQRVKPGIRCYYNGRLIEDEQFFQLPTPTQLPQMSRFIGEAHLDSVPVTTNKNSFDKSSVQYNAAARRLHDILEHWVGKLAKLTIEQHSQIEAREKDLARSAKRVLEHVFALTGSVKLSDLPGESKGRLPPSRTGQPPRAPTGQLGGPGPQEGRTAPLLGATIGEIKRWGALFAWDVVPMGVNGKRSDVVQENSRHTLKINADYPLYQASKKAGDEALELYLAETGIIKICEIVTRDRGREDFLELFDTLIRDCGAVYQERIREKRPVQTRGTINFQRKK